MFLEVLLTICLLFGACYVVFPFKPYRCIVLDKAQRHDMTKKVNNGQEIKTNIFTKGLFEVAEIFGRISSSNKGIGNNVLKESPRFPEKLPLKVMAERIKKEYEALFWVTGNMDVTLWETNCTFADPFSSFGGDGSLKRFKSNADNLGSFVVDPVSKITSFEVVKSPDDVDIVKIGWTFRSKLKLPWKPVLAAAGETSHSISKQTGKIFYYKETWKSKPWDVVKRLFIPST